jgi:hypothetical protein
MDFCSRTKAAAIVVGLQDSNRILWREQAWRTRNCSFSALKRMRVRALRVLH